MHNRLVILWYMQIREYHRKHPVARVVDANDDFEALLKEEPQIEFSGEVSLSFSLCFMCVCVCVCNHHCSGEHEMYAEFALGEIQLGVAYEHVRCMVKLQIWEFFYLLRIALTSHWGVFGLTLK